MKPTLTTRDTLRLMLFAVGGQAICIAGYTDWQGVYHPLDGLAAHSAWEALHHALMETRFLKASHCLVVSNDAEVVNSIAPRIRLDLNIAENSTHWQAISLLSVLYGGHCTALLAESMPKTEESWKQFYGPAPVL